MVSFGERLKRTRENKKMTLDEVSRATKITTRMLAALEEGKFDQLPGGVFNKGFVRAYARHLGLDEEQALRDYNAAAGSAPPEFRPDDAELRAIADRKDKERQGRPHSDGPPWGMIAAFLLVLALGLSIWGFYTRQAPSPSPVASATYARSPQPDSHINATSPSLPPAPTEVASTRVISDALNETPVASTSPDPSAPAIALVVTARQDSWLNVTVDGEPVFKDMLLAGQQQALAAQTEIVLRSGNIGGLEITFNGKKLPPQGDEAEPKTLTFTPSGLKPSSAQDSAR